MLSTTIPRPHHDHPASATATWAALADALAPDEELYRWITSNFNT